jgi:hypothetical protein
LQGSPIVSKSKEKQTRSFLINKNLCFYYWLRKRTGKKQALWVANNIEKTILIFGREVVPYRSPTDLLK